MRIYDSVTQSQLEAIASRLALETKPGQRYFLSGSLGSGKSTFARAFIRALGVQGAIPSPTFIMDSVYTINGSGLVVHHMDLYRLEGSEEELLMLGFEEILDSDAVVLVEWPDRITDLNNRHGCRVFIKPGNDQTTRRVEIDWYLAGY